MGNLNFMIKYRQSLRAFTLVELLVSMAILSILMLVVSQVIAEIQRAWSQTSAKVSQFREARRGFDILKNNLGQATLNTYLRYQFNNPSDPFSPFDASGAEVEAESRGPSRYVRYSELQFICGPADRVLPDGPNDVTGNAVFFQAPLGRSGEFVNLPTALNGRGYFIQFGDDTPYRPNFLASRIPPKYRYRLMEYAPPTEVNKVYDQETRQVQSDWYADYRTWSRPVADNVVHLILSPKRQLKPDEIGGDPRDIAPDYFYNSAVASTDTANFDSPHAHELPPEIEVIMVVIDEPSAQRLADFNGANPPLAFGGFTIANESTFRNDLDAMEQFLVSQKINFRIFNATVTMRNSKWKG
jgi:uncharacterized protein (TIGR02599 family)